MSVEFEALRDARWEESPFRNLRPELEALHSDVEVLDCALVGRGDPDSTRGNVELARLVIQRMEEALALLKAKPEFKEE